MAAAVEGWLEYQNVKFYQSGIKDWQTRLNKFVELEGDCTEK